MVRTATLISGAGSCDRAEHDVANAPLALQALGGTQVAFWGRPPGALRASASRRWIAAMPHNWR